MIVRYFRHIQYLPCTGKKGNGEAMKPFQDNDGSPPLNSVGASPVGPPPPMPVMMPFPPAFPSNKNYTKRDMSLALEALR